MGKTTNELTLRILKEEIKKIFPDIEVVVKFPKGADENENKRVNKKTAIEILAL